CVAMRFNSTEEIQPLNYTLGGLFLLPVRTLDILDVSLTKNLDFGRHEERKVPRAPSTLGLVSRFSRRFGWDILKTLYTAQVLSSLEYCSNIWNPNEHNHVETQMGVQRRA
ncbi:hypothetical protein IscW_ISCW010013, partial [Ixodes scapularis]